MNGSCCQRGLYACLYALCLSLCKRLRVRRCRCRYSPLWLFMVPGGLSLSGSLRWWWVDREREREREKRGERHLKCFTDSNSTIKYFPFSIYFIIFWLRVEVFKLKCSLFRGEQHQGCALFSFESFLTLTINTPVSNFSNLMFFGGRDVLIIPIWYFALIYSTYTCLNNIQQWFLVRFFGGNCSFQKISFCIPDCFHFAGIVYIKRGLTRIDISKTDWCQKPSQRRRSFSSGCHLWRQDDAAHVWLGQPETKRSTWQYPESYLAPEHGGAIL